MQNFKLIITHYQNYLNRIINKQAELIEENCSLHEQIREKEAKYEEETQKHEK